MVFDGPAMVDFELFPREIVSVEEVILLFVPVKVSLLDAPKVTVSNFTLRVTDPELPVLTELLLPVIVADPLLPRVRNRRCRSRSRRSPSTLPRPTYRGRPCRCCP